MSNNNMFMAMSTGLLNALGLVVVSLISMPEAKPVVMAAISLVSPFLALMLLKMWIRADDPPELTRKIAGLKASIKLCKKHLNDKDCSSAFKVETLARMEYFQKMLQQVRSEDVGPPSYSVTQIDNTPPNT